MKLMRRGFESRCSRALFAVAVAVSTQACSAIPRDAGGALNRVMGGMLRVGIIEHHPWTVVEPHGTSGVEPRLLEQWAAQLGAQVEWRHGDLAGLVDALHRREIDVLAAGLYDTTPYARQLALSQPYVKFEDAHGQTHALVLGVTPGESALLFSLDRFLAAQNRSAILAAASLEPRGLHDQP
jgi:polar amino acid transport system substrate-binding protein